ncbi:pectinesterase family protein [Streptomyces sp. L7]
MPLHEHLQHTLSRRGFLAAGTVAAGVALGLTSGSRPGGHPVPTVRPLRLTGRAPHPAQPVRRPARPGRLHDRPGSRHRRDRRGVHPGHRTRRLSRDGHRRRHRPGDRPTRRRRARDDPGWAPIRTRVPSSSSTTTPTERRNRTVRAPTAPPGSATTLIRTDGGFTARRITFANDWLRAEHPDITNTQAVAIKVQGDRSAFFDLPLPGGTRTPCTPTRRPSLSSLRQYYARCYVEGDVDFVFGRATAVYDHCHFRTLNRTDLATAPYGFVFAPSTAVANPRGYLVTHSRVSSRAPDGYYKLARPWVPGSDTTARPMLTVRDTALGAGIERDGAVHQHVGHLSLAEPAVRRVPQHGPRCGDRRPGERPQLTAEQAESATREVYLGDWRPGRR